MMSPIGPKRPRLHVQQLEDRVTPSAGVWDEQGFDLVANGALPDSWKQWNSNNAAGFGAGTQRAFDGTKSLASTGLSNQTSRAWHNDIMPADYDVSTQIYLNSLQPIQLLARGQNLNGASPSYYAASITRGVKASLVKVVNGVTTVLASVQSTQYLSEKWVRVTLKPSGNEIALEIVRSDTGQYLNANGTWQSAPVNAITVNDSSITGHGYIGLARPAQYGDTVSVDQFRILGPAGSEEFDSTASGQLPGAWRHWSSGTNGQFKTSSNVALSPNHSLQSAATAASAFSRAWVDELLPQNVQVNASLLVNSLQPLRLFVRGSNLQSTTPTYYTLSVTRGVELKLLRVVNGVASELCTLRTSTYLSNQWLKITLAATGNRVQAVVYRADTGQYLDSYGNWKTGYSRAIDMQDTGITGVGFAGVERPAKYAGTVSLDNFAVAPAGGDNTAPSVSITSPNSGSTLTGTVRIRATAADAGGIEHVEFLVDGALRYSTSQAPFEWDLDSTSLSNGNHTVTVKAFDFAGNAGAAAISITAENDVLPPPTIPRHYSHIRIAALAYHGTPLNDFAKNLLQNSIDLVVPHPSYLGTINTVAPNTPQLIYTNVSNLYENLLTDWNTYADAHGIDRELAFYHAAAPTPWTGASSSSMPVNKFWSVRRGDNLSSLTNLTSEAYSTATADVSFGNAGQSMYIGYVEQFRELNFNFFLGASNGWTGVIEYVSAVGDGTAPTEWKTLTTVSDTTNGLKLSGVIRFDPPSDWKTAAISGSAPIYFLRIRSLTSGNPPIANTILGRNYSNSNGAATPSGTTRPFDFAADVNQDGYLNDAEYANRASGKDARFEYESRIFFPYYGQMRFATNPSKAEVREWAADYHVRFLAANPLADGLFVDNSGGRSPVLGMATVESSASYPDDYGSMLGEISREIYPKWLAPNTSSGGVETIPVIRNSPAWIEEFAIRPLAHSYQQFEELTAMVSARQNLKSPSPFAILDSLPTGGSTNDPRTLIATLAYYYMVADPDKTFLMFYGGYDPNGSWVNHWTQAAAYNVGQPTGAFSLFAQGADPSNANLGYKVYQRKYDNALVLYKPLSYKPGGGTGTLANSTATTHQLNGTYRSLSALGTLGPPITSITLRNGEGAVLIKV